MEHEETTAAGLVGRAEHEEKAGDPYCEAIDAIAGAARKLTEAGLGGQQAGEVACRVWCLQNGHETR